MVIMCFRGSKLSKFGQVCVEWTLLALLYDYLSQLQQCLLEGEKINGEKMLKTKMAEEGRFFKKSRLGPGSLKTGQGLVMSRQRHSEAARFGAWGANPPNPTHCCC